MRRLEVRDQAPDTTIEARLIATLEYITSDWELELSGGIQSETRLSADLGCESLDIVRLISALQDQLGLTELPLEQLLMCEGRYVDDLRVGDVARFLQEAVAHSDESSAAERAG